MATRDDGSFAGRHEDEVKSLTTQISFLEEEVAVLRRRLTDSPRQVPAARGAARRGRGAGCRPSTGRTSGSPDTLREARDQIVALKEEVDRLAQPPSGFGIFLNACEDGTVDVFTGGRKMRVNVSPAVDAEELRPGQEVVLNEALTVVIAQGYETVGEVVMLKEVARGRRPGAGHLARRRGARGPARRAAAVSARCAPATRCCSSPGPATSTSASPRPRSRSSSWRKFRTSPTRHRWPRPADRADPRCHRAALPARRPVQGAPAAPAQGRAALRPARLRQDAHRQGGGELAGQAGRGDRADGRKARASS